jgi:hypothetical protein
VNRFAETMPLTPRFNAVTGGPTERKTVSTRILRLEFAMGTKRIMP